MAQHRLNIAINIHWRLAALWRLLWLVKLHMTRLGAPKLTKTAKTSKNTVKNNKIRLNIGSTRLNIPSF